MKRIESISLYYKQGNSDKVYEVDLCQLSEDEYTVNFRYGRRNSNLREGTKTTLPVAKDKAIAIYNKLVESKKDKGYRESLDEAEEFTPEVTVKDKVSFEKRNKALIAAVIKRLQAGQTKALSWKFERAIWKAGEFKIKEAASYLPQYIGSTGLLDYAIAWTLGRCGDETYLPYLKQLCQSDKSYKDMDSKAVSRAAFSSYLSLCSEDEKKKVLAECLGHFPVSIQVAHKEQDFTKLSSLMNTHFEYEEEKSHHYIEQLYMLDDELTCRWLSTLFDSLRARPGSFQLVKQMYKLAEQKR